MIRGTQRLTIDELVLDGTADAAAIRLGIERALAEQTDLAAPLRARLAAEAADAAAEEADRP